VSAEHPAPFIPPEPGASALPAGFRRVFGTKAFFKLWMSQVLSSLGDWIGLIAILAIAARVSNNSGAAVSLVMVARVVPGFFLATVGGVIVDRFDRRKVMVMSDIGRALLLFALPFVDSLMGLVLVSFLLEIFTLLYGPAKDASVPNLVDESQLGSANSLNLAAAYGTFPLASVVFSLLTVFAQQASRLDTLGGFNVNREVLALWFDALTFIVSALIVFRLPIPRQERGERSEKRIDWTGTLRDMVDGMKFVRDEVIVRAVIIGMGIAIIGGGAMIPLGPVFARQVLGGDAATFGLLMTALGMGAAFGVVTLLAVQRRLPRRGVFSTSVMLTGVAMFIAVSFSSSAPAALFIAVTGAFAGTAYVSGFSLLQEEVSDDLRGRTFAALYTIIRLSLLISLTVAPLFADLFEWISGLLFPSHAVDIGAVVYALPGVRIALWAAGLLTFGAGLWARRSARKYRSRETHPANGT
jgi:dTMP kinase